MARTHTGLPQVGEEKGAYVSVGGRATEAAPGTIGETQISLPTNPSNLIGVLLKRIKWQRTSMVPPDPGADLGASFAEVGALSTRQGLTVLPAPDDAGFIDKHAIEGAVRTALADAGVALMVTEPDTLHSFEPGGILLIDPTISLYVQGFGLPATANTMMVRLYFQLVEITDTDLIAAVAVAGSIS